MRVAWLWQNTLPDTTRAPLEIDRDAYGPTCASSSARRVCSRSIGVVDWRQRGGAGRVPWIAQVDYTRMSPCSCSILPPPAVR